MVAVPTPAQARPEMQVFRVEELIAHARAGRIRVPRFRFKWEREDVQKLIDSVWRGYPIGSLLLWARPGPAGRVTLGDLAFDVSEQSSAWFVVDGQQRIVSLIATLIPSVGRAEKFDLCFDLETGAVVPPVQGRAPATQLPLRRVIDSRELLAWLEDNSAALTLEQVRLALRVGKAFREYELPAHVVSVDDEAAVRDIFERMCSTGKALGAAEVFNALHAPADHLPALSLKEVVERLRVRSLGELDEAWVLRSLLAIEQKDPYGARQRQLAGLDLPTAVRRVERALDRAFGFLAQDAGIPHLRLLPSQYPLVVLSAYFDRFPTPSARARRLLTRWLWRDAVAGWGLNRGARSVWRRLKEQRMSLGAVHASRTDEAAARAALAMVSTQRPEDEAAQPFGLRSARSKLSMIALAELRPHDLRTGAPLDVTALLDSSGEVAPEIVTYQPDVLSGAERAIFSSVGNRLLHPMIEGIPVLSMLLQAIGASPHGSVPLHVLASHAISAEATQALRQGDRRTFLELRRDQIEAATQRLIDRHAEWDHSDRPSIAALIDKED